MTPALELRGIDKRFGPVHANRAVNLTVAAGTIHGLIGENGAGKSTLMNIVYGFHTADAGEVRVRGKKVDIRRPHDAIACGIGMVHQHFMLVEDMSALENTVLGSGKGWRLAEDLANARRELERVGREYGLEVPLDEPVSRLPVGLQQRVEILKALHRGAEILILDEPTAVLTPQEATQLFRLLHRLREQGKAVILVTHKLKEIMAVTDAVTVLRQGAVVAEVATAQTNPKALAEHMVGRPVALQVDKTPARPGEPLLSVRQLEVCDLRGVPRVKGVTFDLRAGEILGLAGVTGNGQSELLEALAGLLPATAGEVRLSGVPLPTESGPADRRRRGLAHVPEDRLRLGAVAAFSARDNVILGYHSRGAYRNGPWLNQETIQRDCAKKMADWDVRPANPALRFGSFSGGNQQKLVLAREVEQAPRVLLVGQPTRGVDIGAIEFIHRRLVALRDQGCAILLVSVELDEILGLADRILVMAGGEITGEVGREEATEESIGLMMAGIHAGRKEGA